MRKIDPNKIFTEYRQEVTPTAPSRGRKYTMTHSDTTGDLFVTIGLTYAEDKIGPMRDEVKLAWETLGNRPILYGEVVVDGKDVPGNAKIRNNIFLKEMPTALTAIRYGDRQFFEKYPELDNVPVLIQFISRNPNFHRLRSFGKIGDYRLQSKNKYRSV